MALIVTVALDGDEKTLGDHDSLKLSENALHADPSAEPLATHLHHRWLVDGEAHGYTQLKITGPLWVDGPDGQHLGPYLALLMVNGVLYVDKRIFGFFDVAHNDWYITDLGQHWKRLGIRFQTEP